MFTITLTESELSAMMAAVAYQLQLAEDAGSEDGTLSNVWNKAVKAQESAS